MSKSFFFLSKIFIQRAKDFADQAVSKCTVAAYTPTLRANQDEIAKAAAAAHKDNDFVYHERLPDVKTLDTIIAQPIAKPLPVAFPLTPDFRGQKKRKCKSLKVCFLLKCFRFICFACSNCIEQCFGNIQFETSRNYEYRNKSSSRSNQCFKFVC